MKTRAKKRKLVRRNGRPVLVRNVAAPNPLRIDPTRTGAIRRELEAQIAARFLRLQRLLVDLIAREDALALNFRPDQARGEDGRWVQEVGSAARSARGKELGYHGPGRLGATLEKLPPPVRKTVKAMAKVYFATFIAGNRAVQAVAREKGLPPEKVERLAKRVAVTDLASGGSRAAAAVSALGLGPLALPAAFVPWGSVGYLAWSTARNPVATLRAAKRAVQAAAKRVMGKLTGNANPRGCNQWTGPGCSLGELPKPDSPANYVKIARALRAAVWKMSRGDTTNFCIKAAYALRSVYPDAEMHYGYYEGKEEQAHTIVKLGAKYIDVTADQFGGPKVMIWGKLPEVYQNMMMSNTPPVTDVSKMSSDVVKLRQLFLDKLTSNAGWEFEGEGKIEYDTELDEELTANVGTDEADALARAFEARDWSDWFTALYSAALDERGPSGALELAEAAWLQLPDPVILDDGLDAEDLFPTLNVFCPTGEGGGIDPSCGPDGLGRLEGSKGVARKDMPQLKHGDQEAMVRWMRGRGIKVTRERVLTTDLKPLQLDYDPRKVRDKPVQALRKPIVVSRGGRILDGTHHWLKAIAEDFSSVPVIRLDVGWKKALKLMHAFPKTFKAALVANALLLREGEHLTLTLDGGWLLTNSALEVVANVFCPTGEGGGIDPTCSPGISTWTGQKLVSHDSWRSLTAEPGFIYHATSEDRLQDIASDGFLMPHRPSHGTDQSEWPDGSTAMRSYFTHAPSVAWRFAPTEGKPALLRIKTKRFKRESTGDLFVEGKKIKASRFEVLTEDGWKRVASRPTANALFGLFGGKSKERADAGGSSGSNCGTGAGGFKPGNTCAKGDGRDLTGTPEFKAWFGDSKVVDSKGDPARTAEAGLQPQPGAKPLVVFHGSSRGGFDQFRKDKIASPDSLHYGEGFYFTEDVKAAEVFASTQHAERGASKPAVLKLYLKVQKPFDVDRDEIDPTELPAEHRAVLRQAIVSKAFSEEGRSEAIQAGRDFDAGTRKYKYEELTQTYGVSKVALKELLVKKGHDGMTVQSAATPGGEPGKNRFWIVFEPTQIKSTENRGTFDPNDPVITNTRWKFQSSPEQIRQFQEWLRGQVGALLAGKTEEEMWRIYTSKAYKKGFARSRDDARPEAARPFPPQGVPPKRSKREQDRFKDAPVPRGGEARAFYEMTRDQFLKEAFGSPEARDKQELLGQRGFTEFKGMADDAINKLTRIVADGVAKGEAPKKIASQLVKQLKLSRDRAMTIARTEVIRAHAEGQLDALEKSGVEQVGAAVEWSTVGDAHVCELCVPLQGIVLTVKEARGLIPRHPNCRCAWLPWMGESAATPRSKIVRALKISARRGRRKKDRKNPKPMKGDWGPHSPIQRERPEGLLGNASPVCVSEALIEFSRWLVENRFDPNQKRDKIGRWTSSAGETLDALTRGKGGWETLDGKPVPEHLRKLGIPPAWNSVYGNLDPEGDLMARGVDAKGRVQMKYSATHNAQAAAAKFGRVSELRRKRGEIFKEIERDAADPKLREKAHCLKVVMQLGIRPGSDSDTKADYKSYGATTLEGRHVVVRPNGSVDLRFVTGKNKGREVTFHVRDPETARMLVERSAEAGPRGRLFNVSAGELGEYSRSKDGGDFKTKDHRTALGTEVAIREVAAVKRPPRNAKEYKAKVKAVAEVVAKTLGNTPSVALKSYIDPTVFAAWRPTE